MHTEALYKAAPKKIDFGSRWWLPRLLRRRTHTHRTRHADVDRQQGKRVCTKQVDGHPCPRDRSHGTLGVHEQNLHDGLGRAVSANSLQGSRRFGFDKNVHIALVHRSRLSFVQVSGALSGISQVWECLVDLFGLGCSRCPWSSLLAVMLTIRRLAVVLLLARGIG